MTLGSEYLYMIEQRAGNGSWFPRPDLLPSSANKATALLSLDGFRKNNCLTADQIRLGKWVREATVEE